MGCPPPIGMAWALDIEAYGRFVFNRRVSVMSREDIESVAHQNQSLSQLFQILVPYVIVEEEF